MYFFSNFFSRFHARFRPCLSRRVSLSRASSKIPAASRGLSAFMVIVSIFNSFLLLCDALQSYLAK
ncbi:Uncharacterized protein dnm_031640 [Desulfonema magnum]|uniref:Uncharacterized protein n=1 Tax=Desulfonema magnum TaxID=45655 RepID=A0A975BKF5_9BACT|nr:Uncharacterized protein dnm_031640 [Desulfonema magnum]